MSFRLTDLKKSVRKTKDGHIVTPHRLEGRAAAYRIEFLLQQLELHRNQPRRTLDPAALLEFLGDARLGRGLLAALNQWYRTRPRSFAEVLAEPANGSPGPHGRASHADRAAVLAARGMEGPVALRSYLFQEMNLQANGFLDPAESDAFWRREQRKLGVNEQEIARLICVDHPDEAILIRTAPRPAAEDLMAAYNARASTTLLRSARSVALVCSAPEKLIKRLAALAASPLVVEWFASAGRVSLAGKVDALGCWTRHGRRVERAVLELVRQQDLQVTAVKGTVDIAGRECRFHWKADVLDDLGARSEAALPPDVTGDLLMRRLQDDRRQSQDHRWIFRRAGYVAAVKGGSIVPQVEAWCEDVRIFLRSISPAAPLPAGFGAFVGKTPVALIELTGEGEPRRLHLPGLAPLTPGAGQLLSALLERFPGASSAPVPGPQHLPAAA